MSSEVWGAATLSALFLLVVFVAEFLARTGRGSPEVTRKFVHLGGGLVCLLFPFVIQSIWTVAAMACALALTFRLGEQFNLLTCLNRVERKSSGSQYYPFAILGVFYFAEGSPWLFIPSVLVLALADAGAALVGGRFGRIRYTVDFETKSVEGSLVFFLLALACLALPTIYLSELPTLVLLLSSVLVALLLTGVEAVSRGGRDNIFVPLAACLILKRISSKPPIEIFYQNVSLAALVAALALVAWRSRAFNVGGTLTAILFCYASWSLGSEIWAVPIFLASGVFLLGRRAVAEVDVVRTGLAVSALTLPFCILVIANATDRYEFWFGPFVMAAVATPIYARLKHSSVAVASAGSMLSGAGLPWALVALPTWTLQAESTTSLLLAMLAVSVVSAYLLKFTAIRSPHALGNRVRQCFILGCVGALVAAQVLGAEQWRPRTKSLMMESPSALSRAAEWPEKVNEPAHPNLPAAGR